MANQRNDPVGYRKFEVAPHLSQGLLSVDRENGELQRRVAIGLANMADDFGRRADEQAVRAGMKAGESHALDNPAGNVGATGDASSPDSVGDSTISAADGQDGGGTVRVHLPPPQIGKAINEAAARHGVDAVALSDMAFIESSFDPSRINPKSSAGGLFAFTDATAKEYGLDNKFDAAASADAAARMMKNNAKGLEEALGRKPSGGELYLAHQQGLAGARRLLLNPDGNAVQLLGSKQVLNNAGTETMTARQFSEQWTGKFPGGASRPKEIAVVIGNQKGRTGAADLDHVQPAVMDRFKSFQTAFGKSVPVVSGFRDPERNAKAGGAKKSQHMHGNALDLDVSNMPVEERNRLIATASAAGFTGIGVYDNSIHLDTGEKRVWGPSHHKESVPAWAADAIGTHMAGGHQLQSRPTAATADSKANGPVSVKPAGQGFRPSGADTLYGRAYDVAGTKTYLQQLDLTLRQDQAAVYAKYKDDPVMLERALGELQQAHLEDHVFPEIEADYRTAFGNAALGMINQAKAVQELKVKAQDKADFMSRTGELEDMKSQALAGLRPDDPTSAASLHDVQNAVDAHFDAAAARGIIDPTEAVAYKEKSRGDMTVGYYLKQVAGKSADEIKAMRAQMTADYGDGKIDDIRGGDWSRIEAGLAAAEQARRTQDVQATNSLTARGKTLVERHASGLPVTADELVKFQMDAGTAPEGKAIVQSAMSRLKVADAIRTQNVIDVEKNLDKLLAGPDGTVKADDLQFSRDLITKHKQALATDPLGVAEKFGIVPVLSPLPVDGSADVATMAEAFSQRIGTADAVARHFGVAVKYFRPEEASQIEAIVKDHPEQALSMVGGLVKASGRDARAMLGELGANAPSVANAGDIIAMGGSPKAALDLLAGQGKTPDGKPYPDMPNTKRKPVAEKVVGGALLGDRRGLLALDESAASIARKRLYDLGIDGKSEQAGPVYEQAIQEAAGARFENGRQYGGFVDHDPGWHFRSGKILVPPNMAADKFGDVLEALTDADIGEIKSPGGRPWTAAKFAGAFPVKVKGGYAFAQNDPTGDAPEYIERINPDTGQREPVVLDIAAMKDRLGPRVPGAWR